MYNITPFATIKMYFNYFDHYNLRTWAVNVFGNVGVFIPFGFMLPIVFRWGYLKFASVFVAGLTLLELGQMVSKRGSFDVDDIILNTVGATIGFLLYLSVPKPRKSGRRTKGKPSIRSK
ncbi:VanZ family protein [Paenibacillus thermotolerans]|uniref:VanZ family protein n=1 Tax=Paenibacillus thermotolerans TaxID=3027807 RepID=UPI002368B7D3|nr:MULTISPECIES: VanZ family protein [unclassified Paenibacillus]